MMYSIWNVAEGRSISEDLGCTFVETSAKLGINVTESFLNLVRQIRDHNKVCANFYLVFSICAVLIHLYLIVGVAPSAPHVADDGGHFLPIIRITRSGLLEPWLHRDLIDALSWLTWLTVYTVQRLP